MKKNFIVLKPEYMNQFQCIGAACSDTCCAGWRVAIDKRTYKNYQQIKEKDMASKIKEHVKRNKNQSNDEMYAFIQTTGGECGFLNNGLCDIQLNYGEDYLSKTCLTYPRVFNIVDDQVELSAKLSCPEIARLALLNKEPMQFEIAEELLDARHNYGKALHTNSSVWDSCFWDIRTFIIDILQNRSYTVSERMIFLGIFCEKLNKVAASEDTTLILQVVEDFKAKISYQVTKNQINDLPRLNHVQIKLLMEMLKPRKGLTDIHPAYSKYMEETISALSLDTMDPEIIEEKFIYGYNNYYKPFIEEHSYILENYLVNQVFERLFLFHKSFNILEDYILLVALYSMLRFHLQGVATYNNHLTAEEAVGIIQAFSKVIEHSHAFLSTLTERIKSIELDKWALMITLLKE